MKLMHPQLTTCSVSILAFVAISHLGFKDIILVMAVPVTRLCFIFTYLIDETFFNFTYTKRTISMRNELFSDGQR